MVRPDPRFFYTADPLSADDAAIAAGATLVVSAGGMVSHVSAPDAAELGAAVFVEREAALTGAGRPALVLTTPEFRDAVATAFPSAAIAETGRPKAAFGALAARLHGSLVDELAPSDGIADSARIAATAALAPTAIVGDGALIHDDCVVGPYAVIGPGVVLGPGTCVGAHVSVTHAIVGAQCRFSAGVRIGEAGFGYAAGDAGAVPLPQLGRVVMGDRVDIGANTTVDRGALSDTEIGDGTKIDNLCQVAHNCRIGRHVLIASQTGISGSVTIGDGVMIGGQAGMAEHLTIGDGAVVTARAGLMKDVPPGEKWGGVPAKPARQWMKETAALARLANKK